MTDFILKRIEGGYHLDTIDFNSTIVNRFHGLEGLYSSFNYKKLKKKLK